MAAQIKIYHYPNNQFILWDPYQAEILRTVFAISTAGCGNSITISQVIPPNSYLYTKNPTPTPPKSSTATTPSFINTVAEQHFDIYARIGAPPYSIPSFQVFGLLLHDPEKINISIIDVITTFPLLTSSTFRQYVYPIIQSIKNPQQLSSCIDTIIKENIAEGQHQQLITPHTLAITNPLALTTNTHQSQSLSNPSSTPQLTLSQTKLAKIYQQSIISTILILHLHSPLALLHRDLVLRGLYITEGFHYNFSLIIYDQLTHHRSYNQAPPAALTGGSALSTNTSTTTWAERDGSNAVWRCSPCGETFQAILDGFTEAGYKQEKFSLTQERLDVLKAAWIEQEAFVKTRKEQGRMKKYGNVHGKHGGDDQPPPQPQPTTSMIDDDVSLTKPHSTQNPNNDHDDDPDQHHAHKSRRNDDGEGGGSDDDNDDGDEDDEVNLDPLLHVHSRWLLQFLAWNDGKTGFTLPYNTKIGQKRHQQVIKNEQTADQNRDGDIPFFITPPSQQRPPQLSPNQQITTSMNDQSSPSHCTTKTTTNPQLEAWRKRNAITANMLQLGLNQDITHITNLEQQRHYQQQLAQLSHQSQPEPALSLSKQFPHLELSQSTSATTTAVLSSQRQQQPQLQKDTIIHNTSNTNGYQYNQPSVGLPQLSHSVEEINGAVRMADNLHKKVVIATQTPSIIRQAQDAHMLTLNQTFITLSDSTQAAHHNNNPQETTMADTEPLLGNNTNSQLNSYQDYNTKFNTNLHSIVSKQDPSTLSTNRPHFSYFSLEFDSPMSVVGFYKRSPVGGEEYHSPSSPLYPNSRPALLNMEDQLIYRD